MDFYICLPFMESYLGWFRLWVYHMMFRARGHDVEKGHHGVNLNQLRTGGLTLYIVIE